MAAQIPAERIESNCSFLSDVDPSVPKIIGFGETLPFEQEPKLEPKDETRVAWPFRTDKSLGNWRVSPAH